MIIKRIRIENIRSYVDETIEFPTGAVALAGDIGSGKSTILLSAEFALFGIMKGEVSGSHLLRHGSKEGSVTLTLDINAREVIIKRTLRRSSSAIAQESGYLIVDGKKTDLVAKELKARILGILGYSESLLNKSKSLIYRYTVYTPQEDMKRIILASPDERLDTLRNVFGIEKYKTIRENITVYSRELKRNISYINGQVQDLDELREKINEKETQKVAVKEEIEKIMPKVEKLRKEAKESLEKIKEKEKEIEKIRQAKNTFKIISSDIENTKKNIKIYNERLILENEKIKLLEEELLSEKKVNEEKLSQKIAGIKNDMQLQKSRLNEILKMSGQFEYKKKESQKVSQQISSLDKCPICLQEVDKNHKHKITLDSQKNILESEKNLLELSKEKESLEKSLLDLEKKKGEYESIQKKYEIIKLKTKLLNEKKDETKIISKRIEDQKTRLDELLKKRIEAELDFKDTDNLEKEYSTLKETFSNLQLEGKYEEINIARLNEQKRSIDETISGIKTQVEKKEALKEKIAKMNSIYNWLTGFFGSLMISMEKHVFAKIYNEFNDLVSKWFIELIGDETITLRLDNEFTPTLEQNGYETDIENLSGGEKTAVALSYRLALNKVINDVVSTINTKDLIILDEPTDGFSSEQLDRLKDVIKELELKQVIIVSHESKIEGFVDNVIRIVKNDHESRIST